MHRTNDKHACSKWLLQPGSEASGDISPKSSGFTWVSASAGKRGHFWGKLDRQ